MCCGFNPLSEAASQSSYRFHFYALSLSIYIPIFKLSSKMESFAPTPAVKATASDGHATQSDPTFSPAPSTTTPHTVGTKTPISTRAKSLDRWRPTGGGAEHDIFQSFKIAAIEAAAFLTYWVNTSSSIGILSRDEDGTLLFHINPANIPELAGMHIGRQQGPDRKAQWLQVYDQEGVSWLTQSAYTGLAPSSTETHYATGSNPLSTNNLGVYGPSGLTVKEFVEQHQGEFAHSLSSKL